MARAIPSGTSGAAETVEEREDRALPCPFGLQGRQELAGALALLVGDLQCGRQRTVGTESRAHLALKIAEPPGVFFEQDHGQALAVVQELTAAQEHPGGDHR